jgi:chemotaxis protein CheY-P-specific phosphatase CheC
MDAAALAAAHRGEVIVVSFDTSGGIDGRLAVIFDDDVARWMAGRLTGGGPVEGVFGEVALAALAELGNIAASAFLNSAARAVKRTCLPSVPRVDRAPAAAALSSVVPAASSSTAVLRAEGHSLHLVFAPSAA